MPESTNPKAIPPNYRRIEGSERDLPPDARSMRDADPDDRLPIIIRVKASAGRAGLDQITEFGRLQGLEVVGRSDQDQIVVVSGTVAQISEVFAVEIGIHQSPTGPCRAFAGHLHLPAGLAEIVDNVWGMVEREIENIEHVIGQLCGFGHGGEGSRGGSPSQVFDLIVPPSGPTGTVSADEFSLVQQFDVDWLLDPGCQRMLDNLAASPGAFKTIRVMKVFTSGGPAETGIQNTSAVGTVWPAGGSIDLGPSSVTMQALTQLNQRGLVPFVVLGFFPDGIYNGTTQAAGQPLGPSGFTPADWATILANWKALVQTFVEALIATFGGSVIATWWFEVWNEPDEPFFWLPDASTGALTHYQQLYQATSDVVKANGYDIRLGGPAVTGQNVIGPPPITAPSTDPSLMSAFIDFVTSAPKPKCDFLSFHGKGEWDGCLNGAPDLQWAINAAEQTAFLARQAGLTSVAVINDEADMRVSFAVPFKPRMTERFPAWLAALMIAYDSLSSEYAPIRCMAGSDNAELQLVGYTQQTQGGPFSFAPAAFGQQRSIMTAASSWAQGTCPIDLLKVPVYNFYELLRLLGDHHGTFLTGASNYYPNNSDLFHIITVAATHIGSVFCVYPPGQPGGPSQTPWSLNYSILGISWPAINWYQFQIDGTHSNGFDAAGGPNREPDATTCTPKNLPVTSLSLDGLNVSGIRDAQELSVVGFRVNVPPAFDVALTIPAYTTMLFWITPFSTDTPASPVWSTVPFTVDATSYGTSVALRWQPSADPAFYSYQVYRDEQTNLISPNPLSQEVAMALRAALWVDTNPGAGSHTYWIRAVSASGVESGFSPPMVVSVP